MTTRMRVPERLTVRLVVASAVLIAAAAVGSGCDLQISSLSERQPTSLQVVASTNNQSAPAGLALPLPIRVRVLNQDALPYREGDAEVSWTVLTGGGSATPTSSFADGSGIASTTWILGPTLGTQTLQAAIAGLDPVTYTATATEGAEPAEGDTLYVGMGTAAPGNTASIQISLLIEEEAAGLQFRLDFDPSVTAVSVVPLAVLGGLTVASNVGQYDNSVSVAVYWSGTTTIPAGLNQILTLGMMVEPGTASGDYVLEIVDARVSDTVGGPAITLGRSNGKVIVP